MGTIFFTKLGGLQFEVIKNKKREEIFIMKRIIHLVILAITFSAFVNLSGMEQSNKDPELESVSLITRDTTHCYSSLEPGSTDVFKQTLIAVATSFNCAGIKKPLLTYVATGAIDSSRIGDVSDKIGQKLTEENCGQDDLIKFVADLFSEETPDLESSDANEQNYMQEAFYIWDPKKSGYTEFRFWSDTGRSE